MSNFIFPGTTFPGLKWGVIRRRLDSVVVQNTVNGNEARVSNWPYPRYEWEFDFSSLHDTSTGSLDPRKFELQTLIGFFNQLSGPFDTFYLDDWKTPDDTVMDQFIANGDGTTSIFPLYRTLPGSVVDVNGGVVLNTPEPVYVFNNTGSVPYHWIQPVVKVNGVPQTSPSWSYPWAINDPNNAVLTFTGTVPPSGQPITMDYSYFWRVRLSATGQEFADIVSGIWEAKSPIKMISVRQ